MSYLLMKHLILNISTPAYLVNTIEWLLTIPFNRMQCPLFKKKNRLLFVLVYIYHWFSYLKDLSWDLRVTSSAFCKPVTNRLQILINYASQLLKLYCKIWVINKVINRVTMSEHHVSATVSDKQVTDISKEDTGT